MITTKRITPSKIKLGISRNGVFRFYNLTNNVAVKFNTMEQAKRYFADDVYFIDINESKIISCPDETLNGALVVTRSSYSIYQALNGTTFSRGELETRNNVVVLQDNNSLRGKLTFKINQMRRLHTTGTPYMYDYTPTTLNWVSEYRPQICLEFTPRDGVEDRSTRPYRINESRVVYMLDTLHSRVYRYGLTNGQYTSNCAMVTTDNMERLRNNIERCRALFNETSSHDWDDTQDTSTNNIRYDLLHSYHCGPRNITKYNADNDNSTRYFGIELETELHGRVDSNEYTTVLNDLLNDGTDNKLVKFERDGSLCNGVEIITQPMSIKYILEHKELWGRMMSEIDRMGATSHDNGNCGIHVHVSRSEINEDTLDNILALFECFRNELITFSRRSSLTWCQFMTTNLANQHINYIDKDYIRYHKSNDNNHHAVINNGNSATVEFRLFRGTTKLNTFLSIVELVDNIVSIARQDNIDGTTWDKIINYNSKYTELQEYNTSKHIQSTKVMHDIIDIR